MQDQLIVKNIYKSYKDKPVLRGVSINVSPGEIVGVFGPNGAGKTTLFSAMIGLIKADQGNIILQDQDITNHTIDSRANKGLGYLPQESSIFKGLSVEDNIKAIAQINYSDLNEIEKVTESLLDEFHLRDLRRNIATSLSGGERRRLEIARTLASNPKFIMLDEPLAGIDPIAIDEVKKLIFYLKDKNIGIIITDHNVRDTLNIVTKAYIIYDGKMIIEGTKDEIINNKKVREVYLGNSIYSKLD